MTATSPDRSPIRPGRAPRGSVVGRLLLSAAGVDRDVLAEVPEERDRYIGIGGTVVATAGVAAGSMALLVGTVLGAAGWAILLPAVLWGLLIFNLDRWLISSTHGTSRRWALIPRVVLAVLLGIVVAEPLVLWTFRTAIEQEIATQQTSEMKVTESDLKHCNPTDPTKTAEVQAEARCKGLALNVQAPPGEVEAIKARRAELKGAERDRDLLLLQEADIADRLQRERAGEGGGDTTGDYGDGPIAQALERDLTALRERLAAAQQLVITRQAALQQMLADSADTSGTFAQQIETAIDDRLAVEKAKFSAEPGLLERLEALGDLTGRHRDLMSARLFLTLFIVALDCMPVIAKGLSGKTTYDGLLQARLAARERAGRSSLTAEGDEWAAEIALRSFRQDQRRLVAKRRVEVVRDKLLLRLDTEHRDDRAQHGGTEAEIGRVLFEDGLMGPNIMLSWEQAPEARSGPGRIRRILRTGPTTTGRRPWRPGRTATPGPAAGATDPAPAGPVVLDPDPWHRGEGQSWDRWTSDRGWASGADAPAEPDASAGSGVPEEPEIDLVAETAAETAGETAAEAAADTSWFDDITRIDDSEFDASR